MQHWGAAEMPIHTHYDNLKVTRNAPREVIRAAYKAMAQKYHPDLNPSASATEVMRILNEAWDVLGDPTKRAAHDRWIAEQEQLALDDRQRSVNPDGATAFRSSQKRSDGTQADKYEAQHPQGSSPPHGNRADHQTGSTAHNKDAGKHAASPEPGKQPSGKNEDSISGPWVGVVLAIVAIWLLTQTRQTRTESPPVSNVPAKVIEADPTPVGQPNYARCAGSYELEKCRASERELASETKAKATARRERLEEETQKARSNVATSQAFDTDSRSRTFSFDQAAGRQAAQSHSHDPGGQVTGFTEDPAYLHGPSRHIGKVAAKGGLSTIEIDNSAGIGDTEVRLYSNGRKPYSRAMIVRNGASFRTTGISPGTYVIRWRVLGSPDVYEADQRVVLREERSEQGVRYSDFKLTLYSVRNGNVTTTKVPVASF